MTCSSWELFLLAARGLLGTSFGGRAGPQLDEVMESERRRWSFSTGGGGRSSGSGVLPSVTLGRSGGAALDLLTPRPLVLGETILNRACSSSVISLRLGPFNRRLLDALNLLRLLASASLSLRLRSRRLSFRSSFSRSRPHQPASGSHLCPRTFSITWSILTPALRIRCRVAFSTSVLNGGGCKTLRISCCRGACSCSQAWRRTSANGGRRRGRRDSSFERRSMAPSGT
jgi:hypothetical protein